MGVFEVPQFADGTRAVAAGADRGHRARRPVGRRRRRLRGRRPRPRVRRGRVRPHLHRRRCQPRVPRGQGAPRHHGPGGLSMAKHTPHPADGGQLEDEPQPPGSGGAGPEARLDAVRQAPRLRQGRGRRRAAVHRPALGADARRRRPALGQVRRPGRLGPRVGRLHRRDLGGDARQARLLLRRRRPLRAPRAPRRDRRGRQRQGARRARRPG